MPKLSLLFFEDDGRHARGRGGVNLRRQQFGRASREKRVNIIPLLFLIGDIEADQRRRGRVFIRGRFLSFASSPKSLLKSFRYSSITEHLTLRGRKRRKLLPVTLTATILLRETEYKRDKKNFGLDVYSIGDGLAMIGAAESTVLDSPCRRGHQSAVERNRRYLDFNSRLRN